MSSCELILLVESNLKVRVGRGHGALHQIGIRARRSRKISPKMGLTRSERELCDAFKLYMESGRKRREDVERRKQDETRIKEVEWMIQEELRSIRRELEENEARLRKLVEEREKMRKENELWEAQTKLWLEKLGRRAKSWHLRIQKKVVLPIKRLIVVRKEAQETTKRMED